MVGFASAAITPALVAASAALKVLKTNSFLISLIVVLPFAVYYTIEALESPARIAPTALFFDIQLSACDLDFVRLYRRPDEYPTYRPRDPLNGLLQHNSTMP